MEKARIREARSPDTQLQAKSAPSDERRRQGKAVRSFCSFRGDWLGVDLLREAGSSSRRPPPGGPKLSLAGRVIWLELAGCAAKNGQNCSKRGASHDSIYYYTA